VAKDGSHWIKTVHTWSGMGRYDSPLNKKFTYHPDGIIIKRSKLYFTINQL
jgi:hypothetical protein